MGNYARNEENHYQIGEAYKYIIKQVIEFSGHDEYKRRRACRNLILFDIMNEIFLDKYPHLYGGKLGIWTLKIFIQTILFVSRITQKVK